jgi:acyl-CoA reductase-like NAD-dependent aldehyde dehydrogenase
MTGKPLKHAAGEVNTVLDRARTMVALAPAALADTAVAEPAGSALKRKITREPIGVVAVLCPWNYPLICAVRSLYHWSIR